MREKDATTETTKRQPGAVTLKVRAFARLERARAKLAAAELAEAGRRARHDARVKELTAEIEAAEAEYKGGQG
jgi:hypothetical protein